MKKDRLIASTYIMQISTLAVLALCLWGASNAWRIHSEVFMIWNSVLALINIGLFMFQFVIRARLRRIG